uniref:Uncharacterized protein n=1 Tax=Globodera rostochiensis TaxID=31243 RepID=A0A914I138_GLORO
MDCFITPLVTSMLPSRRPGICQTRRCTRAVPVCRGNPGGDRAKHCACSRLNRRELPEPCTVISSVVDFVSD